MGIYIQIGAGAGDLDSRANFRDGFTEYVKKLNPNLIEKIILVEPNPINFKKLLECWSKYPQVMIYKYGIRRVSDGEKFINFFYAEEDGPHYQVFSMEKEHVLKHYPNGAIRTLKIETLELPELINHATGGKAIEMLSIDIEGIDADILLETDWREINCKNLSFEHLHLGDKLKPVLRHLSNCGYRFIGSGLDTHGYDLMYENMKT
jgi:FkbM family methyltransferase